MDNKTLAVILRKEDHDELKKLAINRNTNMSALVVAEILAMLKREKVSEECKK